MSDNDLIDGYSIEEIRDYITQALEKSLVSFVGQPMNEEAKQKMISACQETWSELIGRLEYIWMVYNCGFWLDKDEEKKP